jgi:hypothetical protein
MWWLFQVLILILILIIGSNGAFHWAPKGGGFAVAILAAFAASWLSVWLNELRRQRIGGYRWSKNEAANQGSS